MKWSAHTALLPAVCCPSQAAAPACDGAGSGLLAPWWSERSVTIAQWNHTQNQGFSKVVIVYSEERVESQRINIKQPDARQENG